MRGEDIFDFGESLGFSFHRFISSRLFFIGEAPYRQVLLYLAGDVDGDGLDDIHWSSKSEGGAYSGKVYLILGSSLGATSEIDLSTADYSLPGKIAIIMLLPQSGDVDGDGLMISSLVHLNNDGAYEAGKIYLILVLLGSTNEFL